MLLHNDSRDRARIVVRLLMAVFVCAAVVPLACGDRASTATAPVPPTVAPPTLTPIPPTVAPQITAAPTQTAIPPTVSPPTATPEPAPTMTATPTQTAIPAQATPEASPTPESSAFTDEAFEVLRTLTRDYSPRESGTDEELAAALHLRDRLIAMGYDTWVQDFPVVQTRANVEIQTAAAGVAPDSLRSLPINLSAWGAVAGAIADAGHAFEGDMPAAGLDGRVALIERGSITFEEKVNRVADAGAVAAIVFNNELGLFYGAFSNPSDIPAVAVSQEDGRALLALMEAGEVTANVSVAGEESQSRNVIGERRAAASDAPTVILGAHYDTVPDTEGASDNGSGLSTLLTIAAHTADTDYPFTVRIILFGAEEIGLFGSRHYVDGMSEEQIENTLAMLNFDALGSGDSLMVIGDPGLVAQAQTIGDGLGLDIRIERGDWGSDHAPFQAVGIPALFLISDDLSRINSPWDTMPHINPSLLGRSVEIGISLLEWLAE